MTTASVVQAVPAKIVLPVAKGEKDTRWKSQTFGMIGAAGIGKSEFWAQGDKTLFLECERGLNFLEVMKLPVRSWDEFREVYAALIGAKNSGSMPYDTLVIDTIDKFIDLIQEEVIRRGKEKFTKLADDIASIGDIPNGIGWKWATDTLELALAKLQELDIAIVYIGHLETKEIKEPTRSIHKQTISIGGKTGGNLCSWPDHLLNVSASMQGQTLVRHVRTKPSETVEAKSRGGIVPDGWKWGPDSKENYAKLRSLFK